MLLLNNELFYINKAIQAKKTTYRLDEQIRQSIVLLEPKWSAKEIDFDVDLDEIEYERHFDTSINSSLSK